jgi:hypothetical protein
MRYHVVPSARGGWAVKLSGDDVPLVIYRTRMMTIIYVTIVCLRNHAERVIHRKDGTITSVKQL